MRTYRWLWRATATATSAAALVAGARDAGWPALAATAAVVATLGVLIGLVWSNRRAARWRTVLGYGLGFGLTGVLLLGLPSLIGAWALLVIPGIWVVSPPLVELVAGLIRQRRPAGAADRVQGLSDRDLVRRWRRTEAELRLPSTSPANAVKLVEERGLLLDEVERRDPKEFGDALVRAGWRSADAVVE